MSTETASSSGSGSATSSINLESVRAVAKKDFQDAVRSWVFWGLSFLFFLLLVGITGGIAYFSTGSGSTQELTTGGLISIVRDVTRVIIPLIALILGWKSIAGERESGTIKVLLSLPHSRKDVVLGKLIGRSAVLSLSMIIGFGLAAIVVAGLLGSFDIAQYVGLLGMSILYGIAYTGIAVSLSSLTKSTTLAGGAVFGVFLLFYGAWYLIRIGFSMLVQRDIISGVTYTRTTELSDGTTREMTGERVPDFVLFLDSLDPGTAFNNALSIVSPAIDGVRYPDYIFPNGMPFYLEDWVSFIILLCWIVIPTAIALWRFDRVDL
ncbi:ABC transporter permease [Halostagnicola kamekurae]|uniref:ABC-2 type transport system permease protein n=1 Tax=Halostagnicola kamekurae TaxID=619731 RepID=A0A1I6NY17_9EURY|nr:ABC transporter permease [Halostagnicola kamekurae]SFS32769.1 ABC-2 type transport system permease protein [Halostagnicola kamekurae]